jgi:hypothetical protein
MRALAIQTSVKHAGSGADFFYTFLEYLHLFGIKAEHGVLFNTLETVATYVLTKVRFTPDQVKGLMDVVSKITKTPSRADTRYKRAICLRYGQGALGRHPREFDAGHLKLQAA